MDDAPYRRFSYESLILRDHLALDRTVLANERTFLAYLRTALGLLVAGASFVKFGGSLAIEVIGWAFVPAALSVSIIGLQRYRAMNCRLAQVREDDKAAQESGHQDGRNLP
jgi:putative membrane protein